MTSEVSCLMPSDGCSEAQLPVATRDQRLKSAYECKVPCYVKSDLQACRNEYIFEPPMFVMRLASALLEEPRDAPLLKLLLNQLSLVLPAAVCLFVAPQSHLFGGLYFACNYALFLQRFMLMLHFSEHLRLFKSRYSIFNLVIPYVVCPLYGLPFAVYRLHHVIMHHVENNKAPSDGSATEQFQRDSFLQFLWYWTKFWMLGWLQLPYYALTRKRYTWAAKSVLAQLAYFSMLALLWRLNTVATLWVFVVPFFASSFALMFGNWSQHIFVDPDKPRDTYRSSYNLVATPDNQLTFNDGYHLLHHLNSRTHWSQLPAQLLHTLHLHDENEGLVFQGLGFFDVGLAVFTGRLPWLADHLVPCGPRQASWTREHVIQLLQRRLRPVTRT